MQNRNAIIDGRRDRLQYKFWMFSTLGSAGVAVLLFPYLTYLVMRMRSVRNSATKLGIGSMVQLFGLFGSLSAATNLEKVERHVLEVYVVDYLIGRNQLVYIDAMKSSNREQLEHFKEQ